MEPINDYRRICTLRQKVGEIDPWLEITVIRFSPSERPDYVPMFECSCSRSFISFSLDVICRKEFFIG